MPYKDPEMKRAYNRAGR